MASEASDYSVRRPSWPQEIPGLITVPQHKDAQKPPRRRPKRRPGSPPGDDPAAPPADQPPAPNDDDEDDGPSHLVDVLA